MRTPGDSTQEVKMKAKSVLIPVVLLAVVALSGCLAKTGTGTGTSYINRADTAPAAVVGIKSADRAATQVGAASN